MEPKRIVIIGAGFGGLTAALTLARHSLARHAYQILLIDKNPYHLYTPALYEIAALPQEEKPASTLKTVVTIPLDTICARHHGLTFLQDALVGIKERESCVILRDTGTIKYDYMVLAFGSQTNYFNIPGLTQYTCSFKNFTDAIRIRNKIASVYAAQSSIKVIICGGGASGVELAAECANYLTTLASHQNSRYTHQIILVEAAQKILPGFHEKLRIRTEKRLKKLGVILKTGSTVKRADTRTLFLNDETQIPFDICIWTGGIQGQDPVEKLNIKLSAKKTLFVNMYLEITPRLYAIGDIAEVRHPRTNQILPASVPVAEAEAKSVAYNIIASVQGNPQRPFMPWQQYPFILALGKKYALADLVVCRISGSPAWILKLLVEFRYFLFLLPLPRALMLWYKNIRAYAAND
ncbi:MAG: NADH dehydrogenase [Parcubacteria group bacterium Gr01-1014_66]|nr:MAG: NADH dehydrogenase [Parcubacteria group bacterium Gr01-1014_66]